MYLEKRAVCLLAACLALAACGGEPPPEEEPPEPTCSDGLHNGDETDVDCGGSCPACEVGARCEEDTDCASGQCASGICEATEPAPTCTDGVQNGDETDVDCGGSCPACPDGSSCSLNTDCTSLHCAQGTCLAPTCDDGIQNGEETGVDCGGPDCPPCPPSGGGCEVDADCLEGQRCDDGVCIVPPACIRNGLHDFEETDVDCGGPHCPPCAEGLMCEVDGDCYSEQCDEGICVGRADTCENGEQDGWETDVDCGGGCDPCSYGQGCRTHWDCDTLSCQEEACGVSIISIQSSPTSLGCTFSGTVTLVEGLHLDGVLVVTPPLDLDDGRVGFWVQAPPMHRLSLDDGRYSGIFMVADSAVAADVAEQVRIDVVADYVENDCHSELHVGGAPGSLVRSVPQGSTVPSWTNARNEDGGFALDEPLEGVLVYMFGLTASSVRGDGPPAPGESPWWFEMIDANGDSIRVANDYALDVEIEVGESVMGIEGVVVFRGGQYHLVPPKPENIQLDDGGFGIGF